DVESDIHYPGESQGRPLVWLKTEIKTPPFSKLARLEAGYLLRLVQQGTSLSPPQSKPMPSIGPRCHELRIPDARVTWRIIHWLDDDAIVIADVFAKKTQKTPKGVIEQCRRRLREYDDAEGEKRK